MKIISISLVCNEEDSIADFVRHHTSIVDHMVIVDHGSEEQLSTHLVPVLARTLERLGEELATKTSIQQKAEAAWRIERDALIKEAAQQSEKQKQTEEYILSECAKISAARSALEAQKQEEIFELRNRIQDLEQQLAHAYVTQQKQSIEAAKSTMYTRE